MVQIEIYGVPEDQARKKSSVVKSNGEHQPDPLDLWTKHNNISQGITSFASQGVVIENAMISL